MNKRLTLVHSYCFEQYAKTQPITIEKHLHKIENSNIASFDFKFYHVLASCMSSMIEGLQLDPDTYMRLKQAGLASKDLNETDSIIKAYEFAQNNRISLKNLLHAHATIAKYLPIKSQYKGKIRDKEVYIYNNGLKHYEGAKISIVETELQKLINDIELLIYRNLSIEQVFYYASMVHLVFTCIHPFADGNGRMARLLEKWFLASKIGDVAWRIQSEKLYYKRRNQYYKNLHIGTSYHNNNYRCAVPFLLMLPMSLRIK